MNKWRGVKDLHLMQSLCHGSTCGQILHCHTWCCSVKGLQLKAYPKKKKKKPKYTTLLFFTKKGNPIVHAESTLTACYSQVKRFASH